MYLSSLLRNQKFPNTRNEDVIKDAPRKTLFPPLLLAFDLWCQCLDAVAIQVACPRLTTLSTTTSTRYP